MTAQRCLPNHSFPIRPLGRDEKDVLILGIVQGAPCFCGQATAPRDYQPKPYKASDFPITTPSGWAQDKPFKKNWSDFV